MCVTDRHDMTLAVKAALNPNTTDQPSFIEMILKVVLRSRILGFCYMLRIKLCQSFFAILVFVSV